ncbi:tRNA (adenosine(37)-N6)-dimethylallyltransferase MiaA [Futiania mangrovi]|uniref:tRNA dimethylallyltransferase n=1 Tax=Futiania mangrovi TaxID=2959716 RepID=A0A9J6PBA8_9PROT|nr:tRNA (adenosine(37)-N6)-dimethylallyltransferase MiaA [Futiania mangrovii]MCP1334984.1 tRNA (adenosine(37)-N6)-dimethylallyltransferase MiaA [Futiania mangrovii]
MTEGAQAGGGGQRPSAVLIAGPTASGKTALAVAVAERLGADVVNADSMQVYRDLPILSAQPAEDERRGIPHHLFGHVPASVAYSAGQWLRDAGAVLDRLEAEGRMAVIVGGTGLYFKALTEGLSEIPAIPPAVREAARARLAAVGSVAMHAELAVRDPEAAASIRPGDGQRIVRAWEVLEATGRPLAAWQAAAAAPRLPLSRTVPVVLTPPRDWLYARIDARFDAMMAAGALEEVRALGAQNLSPELPAMRALGVPDLLAHLRGEVSCADAAAAAKTASRRYAKRQMTWARTQMIAWSALVEKENDKRIALIFHFLCENGLTP